MSSLKKRIVIENKQVRNKIQNFVKTYSSLSAAQTDRKSTLQINNALKLMMNFLKRESDLSEICDRFEASESLEQVYRLAQKIVDDDFALITQDGSEKSVGAMRSYVLGEVVTFGKNSAKAIPVPLSWKVIKVTEDHALFFAEKSYLWEAFDTNGSVNWEQSSVRAKLNGEWIDAVFSQEERALIVGLECSDRIFIPSVEQVEELVPFVTDRVEGLASWWTSTASNDSSLIFVKRNGEINGDGVLAIKKQGVRPMFWVATTPKGLETKTPVGAVDTTEPAEETEAVHKIVVVENKGSYFVVYFLPDEQITEERLLSEGKIARHYDSLEGAYTVVEDYKRLSGGNRKIEITRTVLDESDSIVPAEITPPRDITDEVDKGRVFKCPADRPDDSVKGCEMDGISVAEEDISPIMVDYTAMLLGNELYSPVELTDSVLLLLERSFEIDEVDVSSVLTLLCGERKN